MKNENTLKLTTTAIFTAILVLMAFTPLGYLKTGGLEISFSMIPVAIGAILLGSASGAFLGFVFGLTSFIQCFGMSAFGAVLLGINPILTAIVCIVPRTLMGWLTGLIFKGLKKQLSKSQNAGLRMVPYTVASVCAPLLNTALFMTALCLCFYNTDYIQEIAGMLGASNVFVFILLFVGINGLIEAVVSMIVSIPASKALDHVFGKFANR